jgi:RNA polymerase sigma-70 factor (ECF subfamily)
VDLDQTIKAHLAAGDMTAAATAAVGELGPQILGYLTAQLRDDDAAYDVFGHFCEELWKGIGKFRGESSFKTWAYKLVMHSISRYQRDGFRRRGVAVASDELSALIEKLRSSTPPFKRSEMKDAITKLRESLEPDEQTLLFLRIDQDLSWTEVAEVMAARGEPAEPAVLRKRFERAKAKLRKLAEEQGLLE